MEDRLKLAVAVVLALVVAVAIALIVTSGKDDDVPTAVDVADESSTSTTTTSTSTVQPSTTFAPGEPTTTSTTTTTTTSTTTTTVTTTTTTAVPAGGGCATIETLTADGLHGSVCQEGAAIAGRPTTLHLTASDGDAEIRDDCGSPVFEWGDEPTAVCAIGCEPSRLPSKGSTIDERRDHLYRDPGTYLVRVTVESACGDPDYGGETQTFELQVTVSP